MKTITLYQQASSQKFRQLTGRSGIYVPQVTSSESFKNFRRWALHELTETNWQRLNVSTDENTKQINKKGYTITLK